ncbi:MAG TPA: OsmC family protein [bacterium]|nr:OsmC family protein [bacterium]
MKATAKQQVIRIVNGIDVDALSGAIGEVAKDPAKGQTRWRVATSWKGGTRTETQVEGYEIGGQYVKKNFQIRTDEPLELGGTNLAPNPQETLMSALNACMTVGYSALCALEGIELEELRIETQGDIDLRGFFGLDPSVKPGYDEIQYTVHIKGNGTPEQFRKIHEAVCATSPNRFNIANPIRLKADLVVEERIR